jgi:hypothetical protein
MAGASDTRIVMIDPMFGLVLICAVLSTAVSRVVRAHHPGVRTLCHWVLLGTWGAGAVLGGAVLAVGARGAMDISTVILMAASVVVMIQLFGWLLFLNWLRDGEVETVVREGDLLAGLSQLENLMARVVEG